MTSPINLLVNGAAGEQRVRRPRSTDAIGASLRRAVVCAAAIPDDMAASMRKLDALPARRP